MWVLHAIVPSFILFFFPGQLLGCLLKTKQVASRGGGHSPGAFPQQDQAHEAHAVPPSPVSAPLK